MLGASRVFLPTKGPLEGVDPHMAQMAGSRRRRDRRGDALTNQEPASLVGSVDRTGL